MKKQTARTKIATGTGTERPAPNTPQPPKPVEPPKPIEPKKAENNSNVLTNTGNSDRMKIDFQMFAEQDIKKQSTRSLQKGITSYDKRISEHQNKINNPSKFVKGWDNLPTYRQEGLIKHWKKEVENFRTSKNDRITELKERGEYND